MPNANDAMPFTDANATNANFARELQRRLLAQIIAEEQANRELARTDPEAYRAKMEAELPVNTCCFCHRTFRGYGNNPRPVLEEGRACDTCNRGIVITARIQAMRDR